MISTLILAANICTSAQPVTEPCEGVLLPPEDAKAALEALDVTIPRLTLQLEAANATFKVKEDLFDLKLRAERRYSDTLQGLLNEAIKTPQIEKAEYSFPLYAASIAVGISFGVLLGVYLD